MSNWVLRTISTVPFALKRKKKVNIIVAKIRERRDTKTEKENKTYLRIGEERISELMKRNRNGHLRGSKERIQTSQLQAELVLILKVLQ